MYSADPSNPPSTDTTGHGPGTEPTFNPRPLPDGNIHRHQHHGHHQNVSLSRDRDNLPIVGHNSGDGGPANSSINNQPDDHSNNGRAWSRNGYYSEGYGGPGPGPLPQWNLTPGSMPGPPRAPMYPYDPYAPSSYLPMNYGQPQQYQIPGYYNNSPYLPYHTQSFHPAPSPASFHPMDHHVHNLKAQLEDFRLRDPRGYSKWYKMFKESKLKGRPMPEIPSFGNGPGQPMTMQYQFQRSLNQSASGPNLQEHQSQRPPRSGRSSVNNQSMSMSLSMNEFWGSTDTRPPIDLVTAGDYSSNSTSIEGRLTPMKFSNAGDLNISKISPSTNSLITIVGDRITIRPLESLVEPDLSWAKGIREWGDVGPLVRGTTHKSTLIQYCNLKISEIGTNSELKGDKENLGLIWEILSLLVKQNGSLIGTDLSELLLSKVKRIGPAPDPVPPIAPAEESESEPAPSTQISKLTSLLLTGRKSEALQYTTSTPSPNLWAHALYLSYKLGPKYFEDTLRKFERNHIQTNPILNTFYGLYGGSKLWIKDLGNEWIQHLAMVLSNFEQNGENGAGVLKGLKNELCSNNFHFAGQVVQICTRILTGDDSKSKLLISDESLCEWVLNYQLSEIYNYAITGARSNVGFLYEKLKFVKELIGVNGISNESVKKYVETIAIELTGAEVDGDLASEFLQLIENSKLLQESENGTLWTGDLRKKIQEHGHGQLPQSIPNPNPIYEPEYDQNQYSDYNSTNYSYPAYVPVPDQQLITDSEYTNSKYENTEPLAGDKGLAQSESENQNSNQWDYQQNTNPWLIPPVAPEVADQQQQQEIEYQNQYQNGRPDEQFQLPQLVPNGPTSVGPNSNTVSTTKNPKNKQQKTVHFGPMEPNPRPGDLLQEDSNESDSSELEQSPSQSLQFNTTFPIDKSLSAYPPRPEIMSPPPNTYPIDRPIGANFPGTKSPDSEPETLHSKDTKNQHQSSASSSWLPSIPFFKSKDTKSKSKSKDKRPTPMKLPDDKNPSIVWNEELKKWVDVNGGDEDSGAGANGPPPKDSEFNNNNNGPVAMSQIAPGRIAPGQIAPVPAPPALGANLAPNKYKLQKGRARSSYVDLLAPANQSAPAPITPSLVPNGLQMQHGAAQNTQFFVPAPVPVPNDAGENYMQMQNS